MLCIKVAEMADFLALLDAAIDELDTIDSSRCSRLHCNTDRRTGTDNRLINEVVPVVPVVPAQKKEICGWLASSAGIEHQQLLESRAREGLPKTTGTTGTTGTDEPFCVPPVPMGEKENGNEREHATRETGTTETDAPTLLADPEAICSDVGERRAAIVEHDGCVPRAWAGGFARLHPDRPPGDLPLRRWQTFVDDCGRFLHGGWAKKAATLGWEPHDLFGADRDRPFARIDCAGLLWLLNGDKLADLSENAATIETRTGARQTWRRKPVEPGRVLAWEIAP
jgi:hypothetical protein